MIRVITAPAAYPVTLAEARAWCRMDSNDTSQDAILTMLIASMVEQAEHLTGRAFVERTLEYSADFFSYEIELPYPPLIEVLSVDYTDSGGVSQTVSPSQYQVDIYGGLLRPNQSSYWPAVGRYYNPARVRYRAGYAYPGSPTDLTDNSYLPPQLRTWMAARICTLYDNRDQFVEGHIVQDIPRDFADGLLDSLVVGSRLF